MNKLLLCLLFAGLVLSSCKRTKPITGTETAEKSLTELKAAIASAEPQYQWLRMRTRMQYEDPSQKQSAAAVIKIKDDSLIWASVNVLVEVLRAQITDDTAKMMNRLEKNYAIFPTSNLKQMIPIQGLDLKAMQNLLHAYPPFGIKTDVKFSKSENTYTLTNNTPAYMEEITLDEATLRMTNYKYEVSQSQKLEVKYGNFQQVGTSYFPSVIQFTIHSPDKIVVTLDVSEYSFVETDETSFSIPASYTRAE